jgi:hypothetical protein
MGFLAGAFDKSVFTKDSYKAAIGTTDQNGYAVVRITPSQRRVGSKQIDASIVGVFDRSKGNLSFSIDARWQELGGLAQSVLPWGARNVVDKLETFTNAATIGGISQIGAAYASKLIYQKSGFMKIRIPMMVVDWKGNGQPMMSAMLMAYYALPKDEVNVKDAILSTVQKWIDEAKSNKSVTVRTAGNFVDLVSEGVQSNVQQLHDNLSDANVTQSVTGNRTVSVVAGAATQATDNILNDTDDLFTLRSSPVPVKVEIGSFFKNEDMVIESINFEFSNEMTKWGPLYVNFEISLSTRKILQNLSSVGLTPMGLESRYFESVGAVGTGNDLT